MTDFSSITMQYNTGTDAAPTWTGTAISSGGSAGANELRLALSTGSQTVSTTSANWPYMPKPGSGTQVVDRLYAFSADGTGLQITTVDGTNGKANVLRLVFSADGNPTSAMQLGCFADNTHTAPSPGTQPPVAHNDTLTNGANPDTGTTTITAYVKGNAFGTGLTNAGVQETPTAGSVGTMPLATTGAAGAVTTTPNDWLNTHVAWQSLQGFIQYILGSAIPHVSQAFNWYLDMIFFLGASQTNGTWQFVLTLQYTFS